MNNKAEQNKAIILRMTEAFNNQDPETFSSCQANPVLFHFRNGDRTLTHHEHWEVVRHIFTVFPDLTASVDSIIAEDDRVFVRWSYVGTPQGVSPGGVEPTGGTIDWGVCWAENRLSNGAVVEVWELTDLLSL